MPRSTSARILAACAAIVIAPCAALANQNMGRSPTGQEDHGIFQRASRGMSNFFNRLFGTDQQKQKGPPPPPAPAPRGSRSRGPRYNLDQPPTEAGSLPQSAPRSTGAAPARQDSTAAKPKSKTTPPRFTTPDDEPPKSKPKPQSSSPPDTVASSPAPKTKITSPADSRTGSSTVASTNAPATKSPEPPRTETTSSTPSPPPPKPAADTQNVLTGTKTNKAGRVKSPYPPYSELDVTGLPSGSLALDPTTQKIFRVP